MAEHVTIANPQAFRAEAETLLQGQEVEQTRGMAGVSTDAIALYCQLAPQGETFLKMLQTVAPAIPGVGWMVAMAIPIVIAAGKAAHHALCPDQARSGAQEETGHAGT